MPQLQTVRMMYGSGALSGSYTSETVALEQHDKSGLFDKRNNSDDFDVLEDSPPVVETDPTGRYIRYDQLLGRGATKTVYRAFDQDEGTEVAWNQIECDSACLDPEVKKHIYEEVNFLKHLKHKSIMTFHYGWYDKERRTINFITELFSHGTLRQFRKKLRAPLKETCLKRWAWQILEGLVYLHGHNPPILHRDLKCDNIFVNGAAGRVKIGDLGLATCNRGLSVVGTPEFMAPEIYSEKYDEKVDIWAFGMCMLELAVLEFPYSECRNVAQIWKKVTTGVLPAGLARIQNAELRAFIECCLQFNPNDRPSARELLRHPFLQDPRAEANAGYSHCMAATYGSSTSSAPVAVPVAPTACTAHSSTADMDMEPASCAQAASSMCSECSALDMGGHVVEAQRAGSTDETCSQLDLLMDPAPTSHKTGVSSHTLPPGELDDSDEEVLMPLASICPSMLEGPDMLHGPFAGLDPMAAPHKERPTPPPGTPELPPSPSGQPGSCMLADLLEAIDTPGPKVLVRRRMLDESLGKIGAPLQGLGNDMLRRSGANARAAFLRRTCTARGDALLTSNHISVPHHSRHRSATSADIPDLPGGSPLPEPHAHFALVGSAPLSYAGALLRLPLVSDLVGAPGGSFCSPLRNTGSSGSREMPDFSQWAPSPRQAREQQQHEHPLLSPPTSPLSVPASPRSLLRHTLS